MLNLFFKFRFITRFIRVLSPFADSGSGIRVLSSFADSGSGIRVLSPFADSGSGIRVLSPFADSGSGIRVLSSFADSGSGIRVLSPFADSASGIRFRYSVPHSRSVSAFYPDPNNTTRTGSISDFLSHLIIQNVLTSKRTVIVRIGIGLDNDVLIKKCTAHAQH